MFCDGGGDAAAATRRTIMNTSKRGVVQKCHFRVTPEIDKALILRGLLVLGITLI
jgi:hypothetical protein